MKKDDNNNNNNESSSNNKSTKHQVLHRLFWMLPIDKHKSLVWQFRRYEQLVDNIVDPVNHDLNSKNYAYCGRTLKPKLAQLLNFYYKKGRLF